MLLPPWIRVWAGGGNALFCSLDCRTQWLLNLIANDEYIVYDDSAVVEKDWQAKVRGILKAELKRQNLSYADLADRLTAIGVKEGRRSISNKIGRGTFSAVFFFQCMDAIGCRTIHLEDG
jgi:hypothetical protein